MQDATQNKSAQDKPTTSQPTTSQLENNQPLNKPAPSNPIGTLGFEFIEFTGPQPELLKAQFQLLGFKLKGRHRRKNVLHYQQGNIHFILNMEPQSAAEKFAEQHGNSANAMAFKVLDASHAIQEAEIRGAKVILSPVGPMELNIPAIEGIGGLLIYLVDQKTSQSIYTIDFAPINESSLLTESETQLAGEQSAGLFEIDHLTHNLYRGNMNKWAHFYESIFNFREIRYFDITGKQTGLISKAMTSPCGQIRIPLNESQDDKSQIEEFLTRYGGEGIQHIALSTENICKTVDQLRHNGVQFQTTPDAYFKNIDQRLPGHGENVDELQQRHILIDGAPDKNQGLLLQIFTQDAIGPIFFEIIQRKGNEGFGEGNFQALFESIEEDQIRRGMLEAD